MSVGIAWCARQNARHRGVCLGVQEGHDVERITAPCRGAFGVRSVVAKDMLSVMVNLASESDESAPDGAPTAVRSGVAKDTGSAILQLAMRMSSWCQMSQSILERRGRLRNGFSFRRHGIPPNGFFPRCCRVALPRARSQLWCSSRGRVSSRRLTT